MRTTAAAAATARRLTRESAAIERSDEIECLQLSAGENHAQGGAQCFETESLSVLSVGQAVSLYGEALTVKADR